MASFDEKKLKQVIDPTLAKTFTHPLRGHIWVTLFERGVVSPTEIANELDIEVTEVSYHFRKLHRKKLIRLAHTAPRRGFDEHFYEPIAPAFQIDDDDWMKLPVGIRTGFSGEMLQQITRTFIEALEAGSFDSRNRHLTRTWLTLDERGWKELMRLLLGTLDRIQAIQERSLERSREPSNALISVEVVIAAFETVASIARQEAGETEGL
ncbi:MAG TPA: helix-turn-helix domain-containing protein [Solirubrobacterales bacterium]|nr:helix-turn-helix domain-containing protein [Solirubrobacterales bacterium]